MSIGSRYVERGWLLDRTQPPLVVQPFANAQISALGSRGAHLRQIFKEYGGAFLTAGFSAGQSQANTASAAVSPAGDCLSGP